MRFGVIGLGRMGGNLAVQALRKGHQVVGFDTRPDAAQQLAADGLEPAASLADLKSKLQPPRIVLIYVPHDQPTEDVCRDLRDVMDPGDIVVDGGNTHWLESIRHHTDFANAGIRFLDVGTSGGVSGAQNGACLMAGGARDTFDTVAPILRDLAVDQQGAAHVGGPGAGHFVKLVHNCILIGTLQAIAEGVELMKRSGYEIDDPAVFDLWMHGSVIRSWLIELMGKALTENPDFGALSTYVEDTGEVQWMLKWALDNDIPMPAVTLSQLAYLQSRDLDSPAAKAVALLRNQFGGHPVHRLSPDKQRR